MNIYSKIITVTIITNYSIKYIIKLDFLIKDKTNLKKRSK